MPAAISIAHKQGFYERSILDLFSKMEHGNLSISLPSGQLINIGSGKGVSANLEIKNPDFFKRCVLFGDIGFGEAYVDGDWNTNNITNVIKWFLLNIENAPSVSGSSSKNFALNVLKFWNKISHRKRANDMGGSRKNIAAHYDLNNDFFRLFLDPSMTYSSAYFKEDSRGLQDAQMEKYKRLCEQLKLKQGDHVLEIGSGW